MEGTFDRRLIKRSVKERLGKSSLGPQNRIPDLRIKILSTPKAAPVRVDARKFLVQKRISNNRNIRNSLSKQSNVPFLIPRRTVRNEYFTGFRPPVALGRQNLGSKVAQQSIVRVVQNQPFESNSSNMQISADSPLSPIQGYRVEVKNLLRSVTLDDIYELFSGIGSLRSCNFVQPTVANVVFNTAKDAQLAVARYNGRELDGRAMTVTLLTTLPSSVTSDKPAISEGLSAQRRKAGNVAANTNTDAISRASLNKSSSSDRPVVFHVNI
ncbi:hypothetical protein Aperf_G00000047004 [Anoplocephala perfoliata]